MAETHKDLGLVEVIQNHKEFTRMEAKLLPDHTGEWAILHSKKLIAIVKTKEEALKLGWEQFPDGVFSYHNVGDTNAEVRTLGRGVPITVEDLEQAGYV